jgi:CheY-like chemotaxis protein
MRILLGRCVGGSSERFEPYLVERGHELRPLGPEEDPIHKLRSAQFECFLIDREFDSYRNYSLCREIRTLPELRKIPLIILSDIPDMAEKIRSLNAGADDFLLPTISGAELETRMLHLLKEREVITLLAFEQAPDGILPPSVFPVLKDFFHFITKGKLQFLPGWEMLKEIGSQNKILDFRFVAMGDLNNLKPELDKAMDSLPMGQDRKTDFYTCLMEAASNAVRYAGGGHLTLRRTPSLVTAVFSDKGKGVDLFRLVKCLTIRGKTSEESMAMGYMLKIALCDRVYLWTGGDGTTVALEMELEDELEDIKGGNYIGNHMPGQGHLEGHSARQS